MDTGDKTAIFYITKNGHGLAEKLKGLCPDAQILKFNKETVSKLWANSKTLIFIMASGIVVRTIAPLIMDKMTDPAVVVLDEKGKFAVSLLSGHIGGANEIAMEISSFLGGEAVITTASDINNLTPIDLWARENNLIVESWPLVPQIGTRLIDKGALRVFTEIEINLPDGFLKVSEPGYADVLITNKKLIAPLSADSQLFLRPKNLVVGIGCNSGTSADEIGDAVLKVMDENNLSFSSIHSIATIEIKSDEPGLVEFTKKHGFRTIAYSPDELNGVKGILKSDAVFNATGANAVAEPAAMLAARADTLLSPKQKCGNVTVAVAVKESNPPSPPFSKEGMGGFEKGKIYIVGTGPGSIEHITPYAQNAIRQSDVIVGYDTYLDLIKELIEDKEVFTTGMTQEMDRCKKAVELSLSGKNVAVISGGDPGIYAMAGLVFEILKGHESRVMGHEKSDNLSLPDVEVIPGISALNACASRLGAPLMHDFASISLSDRLTPWEVIEKRLEAAARADFVIVLYNPKSMGRPEHINKARAICLKHRSTETPVGIVKAAMRESENITITNLRDMLNHNIDMQTTVIIGNSQTFIWDEFMITPRGYENKRQ